MGLFIPCQLKYIDLALTSGASDNYENMIGVKLCGCLSSCFEKVSALLGVTAQLALIDP